MKIYRLAKRKSSMEVLKENKIPLTKEERAKVMKAKAVWHHGPNGEETPAVWKSKNSKGEITYVTNTHRAYQTAPTVEGAIGKYHSFIKSTANDKVSKICRLAKEFSFQEGQTLAFNYPKAPYSGTCTVLKVNPDGTLDVKDHSGRLMPRIPTYWDRYPMFKEMITAQKKIVIRTAIADLHNDIGKINPKLIPKYCAWCKKHMAGPKTGYNHPTVSHSLCPECEEKVMADL